MDSSEESDERLHVVREVDQLVGQLTDTFPQHCDLQNIRPVKINTMVG